MEEIQGMQQEKTFTQEEVNRIVQDRVARVKSETRPPEDYDDLKEIASTLEEFEFTGSAAEKKAALKQAAETRKAQIEVERLKEKAEAQGISPELAREIQEAKDEARKANEKLKAIEKAENEKNAVIQKQTVEQQAAAKQIEDFKANEETKDIDVVALLNNPKFDKFIKGKAIYSLVDTYLDFVELIGDAEKEAIIKAKSKDERSTSSGKPSGADGGTYGLSEAQRSLAKRGGISYKEYAELLTNII